MAKDAQSSSRPGNLPMVRLGVSAVLVLLFVVFVLVNLETVEIDFVLFTVRTSMLVALVISALLGAFAALVFTRPRRV